MIFKQFQHEEGACLSYLVGCTRKAVCAIVDPQLTIDLYLSYASSRGLTITHIFETHAQADHLSGARSLAEATGAAVHYHASAQPVFPTTRINDGDEISVGNILVKVLHTPGHTADSVSLVVCDTTRSREPWFVFTGDTLFVGDTGRPDLDGDAGELYDSIWKKLLTLPDDVEMFPTHYAGSSCGKSMSPKPSSTLGYERRCNPALQVKSKKEFVNFVMADLPIQPPRFQKVRQYNLGVLREPPIDRTYSLGSLEITVHQLKERMDRGEQPFILDVREPFEYEVANIRGVLVPMGEVPVKMSEFSRNGEIIVHCHHGNRSQRVVEYLYQNGFTNVKNLVGGIDAWSVEIDPGVPRY